MKANQNRNIIRMQKVPVVLVVLWMCLSVCSVCAEEVTDWDEVYQEQLEASGAQNLPDALPEETRDLLEQWGSGSVQPDAVFSLTPEEVLRSLAELTEAEIRGPLRAVLTVTGLLILCAVLQGAGGISGESEIMRIFRMVSTAAMALLLLQSIRNLLVDASEILQAVPVFLAVFVPVYAGIVTAAGQPVSAGAYSALTVAAAEGLSVLFGTVLLPILRLYLALGAVFAATRQSVVAGVGTWLQKTVRWLLGLSMSLFISILALQSAVGSAADSLSVKAFKFVVSSTVPVVGGALNEALNSVRGCLSLLKSSVGAFGILAGAAIFLPVLIRVILWNLSLGICAVIGDLLEQKELAEFLRAVSAVLGMLSALLLCAAVFLILSTGILMAAKTGG